jgi:hypothetical protein
MKKVTITNVHGKIAIDVPDGIVAHLTRECGANVHDYDVVELRSGSFEKETVGDAHSGVFTDRANFAAKNAADLGAGPWFFSAYCLHSDDIRHTRNNLV